MWSFVEDFLKGGLTVVSVAVVVPERGLERERVTGLAPEAVVDVDVFVTSSRALNGLWRPSEPPCACLGTVGTAMSSIDFDRRFFDRERDLLRNPTSYGTR